MKITFLGTGADTAYPLPFCRCKSCLSARNNGGKNLRVRSSLLVNKDLIIDFGPDVVSSAFHIGVDTSEISYCLQTHAHSDHFDPCHLSTRVPEYKVESIKHLDLYASAKTLKLMQRMVMDQYDFADIYDPIQQKRMNLDIHEVSAGDTIEVGIYKVTPFLSSHDVSHEALIYAVENNGAQLLYATDVNDFTEDTWELMVSKGLKFDIVTLDHTYGMGVSGDEHLNADRFVEHVNRMKSEGLVSDKARFFATHISHEGNTPFEELAKYAKENGYEIAFDGKVVEVTK